MLDVIGHTADLAVLVFALAPVDAHVTPKHVERAKAILAKQFALRRGQWNEGASGRAMRYHINRKRKRGETAN